MAIIDQQLLTPEAGWTRYKSADSNIKYIGNYWSPNGDEQVTLVADIEQAKFNFSGTSIRIIGCFWPSRNNNIKITIDNTIIEYFSEYADNATRMDYALVYSKTGLSAGEHFVTIENASVENCAIIDDKYWGIEAIDIDENGILKPYNEYPSKILLETQDSKSYGMMG